MPSPFFTNPSTPGRKVSSMSVAPYWVMSASAPVSTKFGMAL
jgi:hypothetical protein